MGNLVKSELFKLRKDRSFWTLVYLLIAFGAAYPIIEYIDNLSDGGKQHTGIEFFINGLGGNAYIIKFGVAIFAGFFIASEYSTGVMKTIASSGSSRSRIFAAKLFGFSAGAIIISLLFPLVSAAVASLLSGIGEFPPAVDGLYILRTAGLSLLYAAGIASIAAFFSAIFTDSGKTIGFTMVFFLLVDSILAGIGSYFPLLRTVYDYSVFKLIQHIGKFSLNNSEIVTIVLVPVITFIVFGLLSILVYRRKEIK
jgi:ABC-2 type transport system permease protein